VANIPLPIFLLTADAGRVFATWGLDFIFRLLSLLLFPVPVVRFSYISLRYLLRVRLATVVSGYPVSPLVIHGGLAISLLKRTSSGLPVVAEDQSSEAEEMDCTDGRLQETVELFLPFPVVDGLW